MSASKKNALSKPELLAPAGNAQKLFYAYRYGADAAYIGIKDFSLRLKADNFSEADAENVRKIKAEASILSPSTPKRLYCALNMSFHNEDITRFLDEIELFKSYPIDAFIVQDLGLIEILQKHFPDAALHLSTQANCLNAQAAKFYAHLGFSRIILARETSLSEIGAIRDALDGKTELEAFVHGAMCMAYSGRCILSAYLAGRSANGGECAHTCRWEFRGTIEEEKRQGEFFPVYEGKNFTEILSSKDLCMIEHLSELEKAGIDSFKIEGRMKSVYYTAIVTRAYRAAIDCIDKAFDSSNDASFIADLSKASAREFTHGFYFDKREADTPTSRATEGLTFAGMVGKILEKAVDGAAFPQSAFPYRYEFLPANKTECSASLDIVSPNEKSFILKSGEYQFFAIDKPTATLTPADYVCRNDAKLHIICTKTPLPPDSLAAVLA